MKPDFKHEKVYIYGKHALVEALTSAPGSVKKVFLAQHDLEIENLATKHKISVQIKLDPAFSRTERDAVHQGVIGLISIENIVQTYDEFIKNLKIGPDTCIAVLGELQDPHNVGAVIRSAAAMGLAGILIPERNQAPVTGAVVKVSAGMAFRIPLVSIGNVNLALRDLKDRGFWTYGLDGEAKLSINDEKFDSPTVFILGNESKGIRQKTMDLCDFPLSIPMHPRCESMNVASSSSIAFYAWSVRHPKALNLPAVSSNLKKEGK